MEKISDVIELEKPMTGNELSKLLAIFFETPIKGLDSRLKRSLFNTKG